MADRVSAAGRAGVALQHLLPQHALTALAHRISVSRAGWVRKPLMAGFQRVFDVDLEEAEVPAEGFGSFDDFFTRALKPGVRPIADADLVSPCDGTLSQSGRIDDGRILQAKGRIFTVRELLTDKDAATPFAGGRFATIYLAPYDYHRVHMPASARLQSEIRVPGRLFSVSDTTSRSIDRLYARNERMVALFDTDFGPMAVVMVAAMLVAGIETVWDAGGPHRPGRRVSRRDFDAPVALAAGDELGRFHWGSTVVLLTGPDAPDWSDALRPGRRMRLGEALTERSGRNSNDSPSSE
ncbi:archaetidylserine decarboxylase [Halomonas denitrificans]|nr:archaetidylserine decarboxylase [Halomonas denitrificans]